MTNNQGFMNVLKKAREQPLSYSHQAIDCLLLFPARTHYFYGNQLPPMALFKSGDPIIDQYNNYSTEQLIQIVTDKNGSYLPGVVDAARSILLGRGHDYRTSEQKAAEKQLNAINATREHTSFTATALPRLRPARSNNQSRPAGGTGFKAWHWVWLIVVLVRVVACLVRRH